jgi:hypothetical protein
MATTSVRVPGFLPSVWGLRFPNAFPPTPVLRIPGTTVGVGNAADGLCGGMTFMARDLFEHRIAPPPDTTPPPDGPLFRYLVRRAFASFSLPAGPAKYELWMALPDHGSWLGMRGVVERTLMDEWPFVRADLDRGITCSLGLVRTRSLNPMDLGLNHQVLAYGYDLTVNSRGAATGLDVLVYDPNWPGRDDVAIRIAVHPTPGDSTVSYLEGDRPVRGFFRTAYRPEDPSAVAGSSSAASVPDPSPVATGRTGSEIQSDQDPA